MEGHLANSCRTQEAHRKKEDGLVLGQREGNSEKDECGGEFNCVRVLTAFGKVLASDLVLPMPSFELRAAFTLHSSCGYPVGQ